jgi:hypothetical protein
MINGGVRVRRFAASSRGLALVAGVAAGFLGTIARAQTLPAAATAPVPAPAPAPASPPSPPPLGQLELESVDDALAMLGLTLDPHPEGKVIGAVRVVNQEVFSRRDWWLQWFNIFHRTTRSWVLERELLVKPGQRYDQALIEETTRNLQPAATMYVGGRPFFPPELSSVIVILPVASPRPGTVDLLVVTRDVWSLRFNTNFEFQGNVLSLLQTSLSENNLFGWRKYLAANFNLDQGAISFGPSYYDPNIHGTRLTLLATAALYYSRATGNYEGNVETVSLRYPLFSLASKWGAGIDVLHQNAVVRLFQGTGLAPVLIGDRMDPFSAGDVVPYIYRRKIMSVDSSVIRQFGTTLIQQVQLGHYFDSRSTELVPGSRVPPFPVPTPDANQVFLDQVAPASETRSEPYLAYNTFTPRYAVYRDLDTFDLRENKRLGPSLSLRTGFGLPALGADFQALALSGLASWAEGDGDWYALASLSLSTRLREGDLIDRRLTGQLYGALPIIRRTVRAVVGAQVDAARDDTLHTTFSLGGDTGLRGYAIGAFMGPSRFVAHAEVRTLPLAVFSQRVGGLAFYDVGDAAPTFSGMILYHDFGIGLRWLIPQLNSYVLRIDWAFATQDAPLTRAGFPGRVSAGFLQVF